MKILILYPNLPMMFSPALSVGLFTAICKEEDVEVDIFETTYHSDQFKNRHVTMTNIGANKTSDVEEFFEIRDPNNLISDFQFKVKEYNPDLILMSVAEDTYKLGIELLESIRDKNIPNIVGGVFARDAKEVLLQHDVINQVCHHEGEYVVRDAIHAWKNNESLENIKGTTYRYKDHSHANVEQELCNIASVEPDFSLFDDSRWARPMGGKVFQRVVPMETYRGCPYNCTYCNSPSQRAFSKENNQGNFMRRKSADVIEKEIVGIIEKHNPQMIMMMDDSFLARPKKEIEEFSRVWSKYKIPFWMNTRIENCTPDVLDMLREAGIYRMAFGLESGNEQYRREVLSRSVTNETYLKHMEYINNSDIPYNLNVILGMPYETPEMVEETARFARECRGWDALTVSTFVPYRGIELRRMAVDAGFIDPNYVSKGGILTEWVLNMPKPYIQHDEVFDYLKIFALLSFFPDERWGEIKASLKDQKKYDKLMKEYKSLQWSDYQEGGKTRIERLNKKVKQKYKEPAGIKAWSKGCVKHDESSTLSFSVA